MRDRSPTGGNWKEAYSGENIESDASALIGVMLDHWQKVFRSDLARKNGRGLIGDAQYWRNFWAHEDSISYDDAFRAVDSIERLLVLVDASEATEVRRLKQELIHTEKRVDSPEPASPLIPLPTLSGASPVERAVRAHLQVGERLSTPQGAPFTIASIDQRGVAVLVGQGGYQIVLKWSWLEGSVDFLAGKGWVRIGAQRSVEGNPGTLDGYIKTHTRLAAASYVASVLEEAAVTEIDRRRPGRTKLRGQAGVPRKTDTLGERQP
jgi:hypothetical protein